jgi:hypothetical protein
MIDVSAVVGESRNIKKAPSVNYKFLSGFNS